MIVSHAIFSWIFIDNLSINLIDRTNIHFSSSNFPIVYFINISTIWSQFAFHLNITKLLNKTEHKYFLWKFQYYSSSLCSQKVPLKHEKSEKIKYKGFDSYFEFFLWLKVKMTVYPDHSDRADLLLGSSAPEGERCETFVIFSNLGSPELA